MARHVARLTCLRCHRSAAVRNGHIRGQQRYKCMACLYQYVLIDRRHLRAQEHDAKAQCRALYGPGFSYGTLAKMFKVARSTVHGWVKSPP